MSKAEERALEAYPVTMVRRRYDGIVSSDDPYDSNLHNRYCFQRGYEQAEENILSLIKSRISEIIGDAQPKPILRAELEELIKRIKDGKD